MKVAIIEPVGGHGGMDHYDYGLANGLANNNVEVHLHTCAETESKPLPNVTTHFTFETVWQSPNKAVKLWRYLVGHWKALVHAKKMGCVAIHLHFFSFDWLNFLVTFLINRFGFVKVLTIHDVSDFRGGGRSFFRKYILSSFDKIIVHNNFSLNELRIFHLEPNVSVIPHGNYLHVVKQLPYDPQPSEPLRLLFFGQIKKVKGLDVLLKALGGVVKDGHKVQLHIAGKIWHDDLDHYKNLISELGLTDHVKTEFKFIPNKEVDQYFQKTDIVVLPYRQIYQSGVLLLSMSYGRVVLASDLDPFKEIIDDNFNGFIFESESEISLANAITRAMENRENFAQMIDRASERLKHDFDWNRIGRMTKAVYGASE